MRMSGGGGIALFNRADRGLHESLEQRFNILIQLAIFVADRRLRGQ